MVGNAHPTKIALLQGVQDVRLFTSTANPARRLEISTICFGDIPLTLDLGILNTQSIRHCAATMLHRIPS